MKIGELLKENQPKAYEEINKKPKKNNCKKKKETKLTSREVEELMGIRRNRYKRSHGAMKQI